MAFCTACGHPRRTDARFCTACGVPFGDSHRSAGEQQAPLPEPFDPPEAAQSSQPAPGEDPGGETIPAGETAWPLPGGEAVRPLPGGETAWPPPTGEASGGGPSGGQPTQATAAYADDPFAGYFRESATAGQRHDDNGSLHDFFAPRREDLPAPPPASPAPPPASPAPPTLSAPPSPSWSYQPTQSPGAAAPGAAPYGAAAPGAAAPGAAPYGAAPYGAAPWMGSGGQGRATGPPRAPGNQAKVIVGLAAFVVLAAAGTLAGLNLTGHGSPSGSRAASPAADAAGRRTAASARSATASPASAVGNSTVAVAAGASRNPVARSIVSLLTSYFTAINDHDYTKYVSLLDAKMRRAETPSLFRFGYRTTTDSKVTLTSIYRTANGRLAVTVTFVSHQKPSASPDHTACTDWNITLFPEKASGRYIIGQPPSRYHAAHRPCG